jgi:DNA-binding NarL/FixJ family response regulator
MIKVLVYDDNLSRLEGLQLYINQASDMECIGTFENCENVLSEVQRLKPDVVLMDIDMPKVDGIAGLKLIRRHCPEVMVVMQTVMEEEDKIFEAIRAGAHGYFLKRTSPEKLIDGIRNVLEGGAPMTDSVARKVLELFQKQAPHQNGTNAFNLTDRELEILRLFVKGMSYKMVAEACGITFHTVNWHCKKIYEKLHVHSATEAVIKAIEQKIV